MTAGISLSRIAFCHLRAFGHGGQLNEYPGQTSCMNRRASERFSRVARHSNACRHMRERGLIGPKYLSERKTLRWDSRKLPS